MVAAYANRRRLRGSLLVVVAPLYLWLGAMSSVPHKEERFAYVVYTQARSRHHAWNAARRHVSISQVCLSAALALDAFIDLCSCRRVSAVSKHARTLATLASWLVIVGPCAFCEECKISF